MFIVPPTQVKFTPKLFPTIDPLTSIDARVDDIVNELVIAERFKESIVTVPSRVTISALETKPELSSKMALSIFVGTVVPAAPPDVKDQLVVADQSPVPPIQ